MPELDEGDRKGDADTATIQDWFDQIMPEMPIVATRIGYRYKSTDAQRRLADWLFKVSREWEDLRKTERAAAYRVGEATGDE